MKNSRRILVALFLVLTLMMSLATVTSFAEDTAAEDSVTIYFQNNWLWTEVSCYYWTAEGDNSWPGVAMTKVGTLDGNDVYSATIPVGVTGLIINGIKDDGSGNRDQTPDITEGIVDGAGWKMDWDNGNLVVAINYVPGENPPADEPTEDPAPIEGVYTVAGVAALCGSEWDPSNSANDMTLNEDGLYAKSYSDVAAGEYKFKVTQDHSWDKNWPSSDYVLNVPTDGLTVTILFNSASGKVSVALTDAEGNPVEPGNDNVGGGEGEYGSYTVAGVGGLCGVDWDPSASRNDMTYNAETGLYEKTFTGIPAGSYSCKVAANHSWDVSWGTADNGEFGNYDFSTFEEHDITITFNAETHEVGHTVAESTGPSEDAPVNPDVDFDNCGTITVYVSDSANWGDVLVHAWVEGPTDIAYTTWPGLTMEWDGDKLLYYIELPSVCDSVVFNNGSGTQSADLVIPADGYVFDNQTNEWTDIKNWVAPIPPDDTTEDITVTVKNGKGWDEVYIYFWDTNGLEAAAWPGVPMTQEDDGTWTYTIPAGFYCVIFNNGGSWEDGSLEQTPDLVIPTNGKTYIDISDSVLYNDGSADDNNAWKNLPSSGGNQGGNDSGNQGGNDSGNQGGNNSGNQGGNSGSEEPKQEMTWLQQLALQLLLFLRSIEDFFKGLFGG